VFDNSSTAGSATLIANGGINGGQGGGIFFQANSTGGTSRIEVFGNGNLDISPHRRGLTIGSIEGDGNAFLGAKNLTVGSNNLSTTFSGVIQDGGGSGGTGGSLTKIGTGTLILSGVNTYTGDTRVNRGVLQVDGSISSNTVRNFGTLAGRGTVYGNVRNHGKVSPGDVLGVPGTLTVVQSYTQAQYAHLMIQIAGANAGQFSVLDVLGFANLSGHLDPVLLNGFVPTVGETFTFLNYGAVNGTLFMFNPNIDNLPEHWEVSYFPTHAILAVVAGNVPVPDQGSTFVLLTLGLLCLVTYRQGLLRRQP
jgi:autotransporter-associated beta strand protein